MMDNRNNPSNPTPPASNSLHTPPSFDTSQLLGQRFRQAREEKGLSLEQAAQQTFILKRHLEALEANDFSALPQPTFARGFANNYGRFLGLDSQLVNQSFNAQYPTQLREHHETVIKAPMQPMGTLNRDSHGRMKINPFIILGVVASLLLAFFIFNMVNKAHQENQVTPATTGVQGITPEDQITGASLTNAGSAIPTATNLPANGTALAGIAPMASSATATASGTLEVWVQKPTTVTITDANGQVLMQGEQAIGSNILQGQPPFNVNISNVKTVSIDFNKQPIRLQDYAQANNQANFILKP